MIDDLIYFMGSWPKNNSIAAMAIWFGAWTTVITKMLIIPSLVSGVVTAVTAFIKR